MSNIHHIYRHHRGWTNSKGKDFWRKKARQVRQSVEGDRFTDIRHPPRMKRMLIVFYKIGTVRHRIVYVVGYGGNYRGQIRGARTVVPVNGVYESHERIWVVGDMQWCRLELAKAHREGLNFHYARWCMVRDTPAEVL